MPLWIAITLMTAAAVMAVLWPLRVRPIGLDDTATDDGRADLAVYRDQMAEIERDRATGRIAAEEAEAARTEVARRMLAADRQQATERAPASRTTLRRRIVAVAALVGLPMLAGTVYLTLGSPGLEGQPLAARLDAPPERAELAVLLRRVEERLEANPDDGRGHELVAPIYLKLGRMEDAARAYAEAIRTLGASAEREAGRGEALTMAAGGVVTAEARAAFERATAIDPLAVRARYYLGLAAEQDGDPAAAAKIWSALADGAPAGAPWLPAVRAALARVAPPQGGPSAEDVAAAQQLSPDEQKAMVRGMVDRLAERLERGEGDIDEWLKLVRAWSVLGEADKARQAAGEARRRFAGDQPALGRIEALARELGLES